VVQGLRVRPGTPVRPTGPANKAMVDPAASVRQGRRSQPVGRHRQPGAARPTG